MEKIRTIVVFLLLFIFILFSMNKNIIANKREITDFELIEVVGIDMVNDEENRIEISLVRNKIEEEKEGAEQESDKPSNIISIKGTSYNDALRKLQTTLSKHILNWHVKYFIIGEETAKSDLVYSLDYLIRDTDTKFNSRIYISKGKSAKELLNSITNSDYKLSDKLENMEKNIGKLSVSSKVELTDILKMICDEDPKGLIPTLENYELDIGEKRCNGYRFWRLCCF